MPRVSPLPLVMWQQQEGRCRMQRLAYSWCCLLTQLSLFAYNCFGELFGLQTMEAVLLTVVAFVLSVGKC